MTDRVSVFPILNKQCLDKIRLTNLRDYHFAYEKDEETFPLETEETGGGSGIYKIVTDGVWDPDHYNLHIERTIELQNTGFLFGRGGIVCANAELGAAVLWTSADSRQRGALTMGTFDRNSVRTTLKLDHEFGIAQLRGRVDFSLVFYVCRAGTPNAQERYLANTYGFVLGELDHYIIRLDGNGSVFPIFEVSEPGQPLWHITCDWEDPSADRFSESVALYLNKDHPGYRYLDRHNRAFDRNLINEIVASALEIVITRLKSDQAYWKDVVDGNNIQKGSVSEAVNYFIATLGWDVTSPESLAVSIHKFFDRKATYADQGIK